MPIGKKAPCSFSNAEGGRVSPATLCNLASNIAALASYLLQGHVVVLLGLPAAIFTILGAQVGSSLAIHRGARFIRHMLLVVLALLLARMLTDVLS